jgi:hypothetical protein
MGVRSRRQRGPGHRHAARQRAVLPAAGGADAHQGRAGDCTGDAALAAGAGTAPAAGHLCRACITSR